MAIQVTDDLIRHIARLSRLAISEQELKGVRSHFEKILAYIGELQALEISDVDPSIFSVGASNVFREDSVRPSLDRAAALSNAPRTDGTYFIVPRIVGGAPEHEAAATSRAAEDEAGGAA